jgi:hypothetical protein
MNRLLVTVAAATLFLATGSLLSNRAEAVPVGRAMDIPLALDGTNPIEKVALCFYVDGWNGPGLYQCGYRLRYGEGFERRREEREERRERFERRDRFEDRRERGDRFEDRRERRDRYEDRRERRDRY